jgi:hypothetical protein
MSELINSMVETEAELIDIEVDDDGMVEIEAYEIQAQMMINELDEEVDILYRRLLIQSLPNDEVAQAEMVEV